jgi:hypothetical protein
MKNLFLLLTFWIFSNQGFCQQIGFKKLFYPLEVVSQNDTPNPVLIQADGNNAGLAAIALNTNNSTATSNFTIGRAGSNAAIISYNQSINNLEFRVSNQSFRAIRVNAANNFVAIDNFNVSPTLAQLEVNGTTQLGSNGTALNSITKSTQMFNIPTIAAGQTGTMTFLLTNLAPLGSVVSISPDANLDPRIIIDYVRVSSSGIVDMVITNISPTNAVDPPAMNFHITVIN